MQQLGSLFVEITGFQVFMYVAIFFAKLVEVSLATVRSVLINRGEKLKGAIIGFFEVLLWVTVASQVLGTITEDPFKVVVYCFAFACGNYLGVIIEGKLAIGTASMQVFVSDEVIEELSALLRGRGFGVTIIEGQGKDGPVQVLLIFVKRKCVDEAIGLIRDLSPHAMITVNDVRHLRNGYMRK